MGKVIISTNENPDYFFYAPIATWAWNKQGWDVAIFGTKSIDGLIMHESLNVELFPIPDIEGVRTGTLAQTVRHFAANLFDDEEYLMVQDIDLLPLKPWNPDPEKKTIYGWELTGKSFIPVHYTGMKAKYWKDIMGLTGDMRADMERELKANGRAYKEKWEDYWDTDWDILTKKVLARKKDFTFIERGMVRLGKYETAKGRVDRCSIVVEDGTYRYDYTLNQDELIDIHCENHNPSSPDKWKMNREVLVKVFGELPSWMDDYVAEHHKKYGQ